MMVRGKTDTDTDTATPAATKRSLCRQPYPAILSRVFMGVSRLTTAVSQVLHAAESLECHALGQKKEPPGWGG